MSEKFRRMLARYLATCSTQLWLQWGDRGSNRAREWDPLELPL